MAANIRREDTILRLVLKEQAKNIYICEPVRKAFQNEVWNLKFSL